MFCGWVGGVFLFFFLLQKSSMMDQSIFIVLPDTLWSFLLKCIILCSNIFLWTTLISVGSLEGLSVYYCHFCLQRATSPWKEKNITNSKHCGLFLVLKYVYHDDFCCPRTEPKTKVLKSRQLFCLILLFLFFQYGCNVQQQWERTTVYNYLCFVRVIANQQFLSNMYILISLQQTFSSL